MWQIAEKLNESDAFVKKTVRWLHQDDFREWVAVDPQSKEKAFCKLCKKTVDIGNMGEAALVSYMSGKKHKAAAEVSQLRQLCRSFDLVAYRQLRLHLPVARIRHDKACRLQPVLVFFWGQSVDVECCVETLLVS